ncbi:hypothetical protein [Streptomyces sp. NPDC058475]|uniref:hypothetical protein n=1 Tax=Streptomyces sp. NPDC058475 TaxID=3346518 RepID=UPI00365597EC
MHSTIYVDASESERRLAEIMGIVMQSFARLAGRLHQGEWLCTRIEAGQLRNALAGLDALLPSRSGHDWLEGSTHVVAHRCPARPRKRTLLGLRDG